MQFVYVMNVADKDIMLQRGYRLIKEDFRNNVWVFQNRDSSNFNSGDTIEDAGLSLFVLSDTLTF